MTSTPYDAADYQRPSVTVDTILFSPLDGTLHVLLIRRGRWPFEGFWAIPGGFVEIDESLEDAAVRELFEETGLADVPLQQLQAFGDPGRDPRTRVITVTYVAKGLPHLRPGFGLLPGYPLGIAIPGCCPIFVLWLP